MLVGGTQHHPLSAADEQINHGKQNTGPQSIVLPGAERLQRAGGTLLGKFYGYFARSLPLKLAF